MNEDMQILWDMFIGLFYGLEYSDFALPIGMILWFMVFFVKIYDIDLDDVTAQLMFVLWNMFSGVVLGFAYPQVYTSPNDIKFLVIMVIIFGLVSVFFWDLRRKEKINFRRMKLNKNFDDTPEKK